jgi:Flp pilus assembly protein TadG
MPRSRARARHADTQSGQILVIAALAMLAIIGGVALVLEGGNAYANQRIAQNAADAVAHAGASVLAQRLGGTTRDDDDVASAMDGLADANGLASFEAYYVNVLGQYVAGTGLVAASSAEWVEVGSVGEDLPPPPKAQGVRATAVRSFGTTFGRVIGLTSLDATAEATAVMGRLTGGTFLPMVLPVSPSECSNSGFLQPFDDPTLPPMWYMSNPGTTHPDGTEYVVPLCKTGGGSFMFLDLDPDLDCDEEVIRPPSIQFDTFPADVDTDNGADCQTKVADAIDDADLQGRVVLIPVCDNECITGSGSNATYHIIRIAAFYVDFMQFTNGGYCDDAISPNYATPMVPFVSGNSSDGCMAGWFVRYITAGPVGSLDVYNGEAIGVQLIR